MKGIPFDQTRSLFGNVSLLVTDVIRIFENDLKQTISLSGCWPVRVFILQNILRRFII